MKYLLTLAVLLIWSTVLYSQTNSSYTSLCSDCTIDFANGHVIWGKDSIFLGPKSFFIDGSLSASLADQYPYVFNSIQNAVEKLIDGTEEEPMTMHIAPYVYWIDDPDDPAVRVPAPGDRAPYGMKIKCEWLRFHGLSDDPMDVVLACNRGQTLGSRGNFTMFQFSGDGTSSENITFGNYCNIDLEYPLDPKLSRVKRAEPIVQAQLIHCDGDKIVARNTRFVSRLNLCPFVGGKRVLFDKCHFESTDDALCGTGVYLNSDFDFYSSKPFYITRGTGAVFLNCEVNALTKGRQYFTKAPGQMAVVDTRFVGEEDLYIGWKDVPPAEQRNYQFEVSLNGKPVFVGEEDPERTVRMENKSVLDAYRIENGDEVLYNTYNLLKGDDDWDPMGIKNQVLNLEKDLGRSLMDIPTQLLVTPTQLTLETGKDTIKLTAEMLRFGNYPATPQKLTWSVLKGGDGLVELEVNDDTQSCLIIPTNSGLEPKNVVVQVSSGSGLEAASLLTISPALQRAPDILGKPKITISNDGFAAVNYELNTKYADQSRITWYRCENKAGANPIPLAVTRFDEPLKRYELVSGDEGYYLMAGIAPKHITSLVGEEQRIILKKPISESQIKATKTELNPDFSILSTSNQSEVKPGFWTWSHVVNPDRPASGDAWHYGEGKDGGAGVTGLLQGRSGFMAYTPVQGLEQKDMSLEVLIAPFKTAGQGFAVAPLYMDLLIKYDAKTMNGYGLRVERTTKYGNSVDFVFVKYENGEVTRIGDPVSTSCYRPKCKIALKFQDGALVATASTTSDYDRLDYPEEVLPEVSMKINASPNELAGFGIFYYGGAPAVFEDMLVKWE